MPEADLDLRMRRREATGPVAAFAAWSAANAPGSGALV